MSRPNPNARAPGQIRQSQVVTTFGPGSLIDLPTRSVIIGGLEQWMQTGDEIYEPRLIEKLKRLLDRTELKLFAPPPDSEDPTAPRNGIVGWQFPEWFVTQEVTKGGSAGGTRSRRLVHRKLLTKYKFIDDNRKGLSVVPVRFVQACRRGHISDIDWIKFAHRGSGDCFRPLWMDERGTSGDLGEVVVRCECGQERRLSDANGGVLGKCGGQRPWLGAYSSEACDEQNRLLIRHASNAYFPQVMSVISLPDRNESLEKAVNNVWENFLQYVDDVADLAKERTKKPPVKAALEGFADEEVMREIRCRKGLEGDPPVKTVKAAEFELLSNTTKESLGEDAPDSEFFARRWMLPDSLPEIRKIERVVLVHKLREVTAQLGFTRFEALSPDIDGELQMGVQAADLALERNWLPAIENRGEGLFIEFKKAAVDEWRGRQAVIDREVVLRRGFNAWIVQHPHTRRTFPGVSYILMHSLSHVLLTAISLECGYPASSIRERVYASDEGYGILLYTGTPDAEGTLGGLIEAGKHLDRHLLAALELARLCSNDPVCSQHDPMNPHESRFLHGAACHGCLLVAETSCEQHNDYLDRALLVPTIDLIDAAFFTEVIA